jgi:hypothetical protein
MNGLGRRRHLTGFGVSCPDSDTGSRLSAAVSEVSPARLSEFRKSRLCRFGADLGIRYTDEKTTTDVDSSAGAMQTTSLRFDADSQFRDDFDVE